MPEEKTRTKKYKEIPPEDLRAQLATAEPDPEPMSEDVVARHLHGVITPKLVVKKLPHYSGLPDPAYATEGSSGFDLMAAIGHPLWMATIGDRLIIPTGLSLEIPPGWEAQVRPRSGMAAKFGITVLNTPGTIDSDYRGEVKVVLVNTSNRKFEVTRGMRIAQLVLAPVRQLPIEFADQLTQTKRGAGGFGSTGTH